MNISLRFWLILSFSVVILICLTALVLSIQSQNETNKIESYIQLLQNTRITLLKANKLKEDIFITELINPEFYEHKNSIPERKFNVALTNLRQHLKELKNSSITTKNNFRKELNQVNHNLITYEVTFNELIRLFKTKGYKNYGIEGEMREYAHAITEHPDEKIKYYSLLLRKNEKDFLIRKEQSYISGFNKIAGQLITYIFNNKTYTQVQKNNLYHLIYFYQKKFKIIACIENKIGFKGRQGLLSYSDRLFEKTNFHLETLEKKISISNFHRKETIKAQSIIIFATFFIFLVGIIYVLTKAITHSLYTITKTFNTYILSGFSDIPSDFRRSRINEFNIIYIDFLKMVKEINSYTNYFKEKVNERTLEINKQKEEIQLQQKQIELQYDNLLKTNSDLILQKKLLNDKNTDVVESLKYAKRIQKALIPKQSAYTKYFKDSFVFTKAKDIVSGDFNLIYPYKTQVTVDDRIETHNNVLFIGADCTGHGVPGAFISVLGINSINKLVKLLNITDPGNLLNHLDSDINQFLSIDKKDKDLILDGMDISVFSFNTSTYMLQYCIAKYACILIRNSTFIELNSQNHSIGYNITSMENNGFTTSRIQLQENDHLYLLSDGYSDQFGGPLNKKYKKRSLYELVMSIHTKSMKEQKAILKQELKSWQKHYSQTDDITIIGLKF